MGKLTDLDSGRPTRFTAEHITPKKMHVCRLTEDSAQSAAYLHLLLFLGYFVTHKLTSK